MGVGKNSRCYLKSRSGEMVGVVDLSANTGLLGERVE